MNSRPTVYHRRPWKGRTCTFGPIPRATAKAKGIRHHTSAHCCQMPLGRDQSESKCTELQSLFISDFESDGLRSEALRTKAGDAPVAAFFPPASEFRTGHTQEGFALGEEISALMRRPDATSAVPEDDHVEFIQDRGLCLLSFCFVVVQRCVLEGVSGRGGCNSPLSTNEERVHKLAC